MVKRWTSAAASRVVAAAGGGVDVPEAVELVVEGFLDGGVPTDLASIAAKLNVSGWRAERMGVAGELRREGDSFKIAYASGMSLGRRRFTIAHELGHAFFESTGPRCPRVGDELERICDRFAAALLMPAATFASELEPWTPARVIELADRFQVSLSAVLLRSEELGDRHGVVLRVGGEVVCATGMLTHNRTRVTDMLGRLATRALDGFTDRVVLPRNRRWNGMWELCGAPLAGGEWALVTGVPLDALGGPLPRNPSLRRSLTDDVG